MDALALLLPVLACLPQEGSEEERTIDVGESVPGVLSPDDPVLAGRGPSQRFVLFADEGPVTITFESYDFDAFLRAEDSAGEVLAEDDDGGVETNAALTLPSLAEGSCWIIASSKGGGGEFELSAQAGDVPRPSDAALLDAAIDHRSSMAERALTRGDRLACANHRLLEGILRSSRSQFPQAKKAYESSLAIYRELENRAGEARALGGLGNVNFSLSEYAKAREHHEQSLALSRELGDRASEARALGNLGNVYESLGDYPKAREHHEQCLALLRKFGDRAGEATTLGNLGIVFLSIGDYERAREHFEQYLALSQEIGDREGEARALGNLGIVYISLGEYAKSREYHEQHLALSRKIGNRAGEARAHGGLGNVYSSLGEYTKAREHHEQHLALSRELGDRRGEATALGNLGNVNSSLGEYANAREHYEQDLALARRLGDRAGEARAFGNLGNVYRSLDEYARAREHIEQHLSLARELGDRAGEATALGNLGNVYISLGEYANAREHYEQHLALSRELGDRAGEAAALGNLGIVYHLLGEYAEAGEYHERRLVLAREIGDRAGEAGALGNLGSVYYSLGEYAKAREHHEQHLALSRELGDRAGEATALGDLGNVHFSLGEYASAREHYELQLALSRELGNRAGEAVALGNIGGVWHFLGEYAKAQEHYEQDLAISRELKDRAGQARALANLGGVYSSLGEHAKAQEHQEQCLALSAELGDLPGEARALGNLGLVYRSLGDYAEALEHHEPMLALARELGDRAREAAALASLGNVYHSLGEYARARELANEAAVLAAEVGSRAFGIHADWTLARACIALEDSDAAGAALKEAERYLCEVSEGGLEMPEASSLRSQFAGVARTAQELTALLLRQAENGDQRGEAVRFGFGAAGRWKGRALLEGIAEHRAGARSAEAIGLRSERREALASRDAILERVSKAIREERALDEVEALRAEAQSKVKQVERLNFRLREVSPKDAALDLPLGASPEEVKSAVLGLRDLLVEYAEGEERQFAYVLGAEGIEFLDLGTREEIEREVEEFLSGVRDQERLVGAAELGRRGKALFERLLAPAFAWCEGSVERLIVVPNAALSALPFEALVVESTRAEPASVGELVFVLDRYEVTYAPSSPVLVELASMGPRKTSGKVLLLADPIYALESVSEASKDVAIADASSRALRDPTLLERLPGTRSEALAIAELFAGADRSALEALTDARSGSLPSERFDLHLGSESSRARLDGDLRGYSILHLACHGHVDAEFPQRTGIALSRAGGDDGYFTIGDALELDLDADLVVLSACETAQGKALAGEGIESLARAFMYAGARGVVASQWRVWDWAAAETMEAFYRGMFEEGLSPSRALREAKLRVRRGETSRGVQRGGLGVPVAASEVPAVVEAGHPFYWAPFIHIGLAR